MPRRQLQLLWRLVVPIYLLEAAAALAVLLWPEHDKVWPIAAALGLALMGAGTVFALRPQPFRLPDESAVRRASRPQLRALRRAQPLDDPNQRAQTIDWGRRSMFSTLTLAVFFGYLSITNATTSSEGVSRLIAHVLTIAGLAGGIIAVVGARWRMTQLDSWEDADGQEDTTDPLTVSSTNQSKPGS